MYQIHNKTCLREVMKITSTEDMIKEQIVEFALQNSNQVDLLKGKTKGSAIGKREMRIQIRKIVLNHDGTVKKMNGGLEPDIFDSCLQELFKDGVIFVIPDEKNPSKKIICVKDMKKVENYKSHKELFALLNLRVSVDFR
jgi:hypothetical protein